MLHAMVHITKNKFMTNEEFNESFRLRTKKFALDIIRFLEEIPFTTATKVLTYQLGKAGTSVGANFRAFCRARSKNERYSKICIVVEEADESIYWLELFDEANYGSKEKVSDLLNEGLELLKVMASIKHSMNLY